VLLCTSCAIIIAEWSAVYSLWMQRTTRIQLVVGNRQMYSSCCQVHASSSSFSRVWYYTQNADTAACQYNSYTTAGEFIIGPSASGSDMTRYCVTAAVCCPLLNAGDTIHYSTDRHFIHSTCSLACSDVAKISARSLRPLFLSLFFSLSVCTSYHRL